MPLYKSTIISIPPWSQQRFKDFFGWGTSKDIENLVDLAQQTGRIQFTLINSAVEYENLEWLDPVFLELKPPLPMDISAKMFQGEDYDLAMKEFYAAAKVHLIPFLLHKYPLFSYSLNFRWKRYKDYESDYVSLKLGGYQEIAKKLLHLMAVDFELAHSYFTVFGNLLASPLASSIDVTYNLTCLHDKKEYEPSLAKISGYDMGHLRSKEDELLIPDIGKFLMSNQTYALTGFDASKELMGMYDDEDIPNLINAIQQGCKKKKIDVLRSKSEDLNTILNNVWKDADRISKISNMTNYAFTVSIGICGQLVGELLGTHFGGILASIGVKTVDRFLIPNISDKLTRTLSPDHLLVIHDFKQRYPGKYQK